METLIRSVLCKEVLVLEHIIIRPATEADAEEMLALYAPYVLHTTVTSEYAPPTLEEFREAIEKQKEERPVAVLGTFGGEEYECRECGNTVEYMDEYCKWCGKKLDWSEEE